MDKCNLRILRFCKLKLAIAFLVCSLGNSLFPDELFILKYGESLYPSHLTNRKSTGKIPMDWLFYLYLKGDRVILFDTGTEDISSVHKFSIKKFIRPDILIKSQEFHSGDVTDLFVTHFHFDHSGGIFLFPDANLHIHPLEYSKIKQSPYSKKFHEYFKKLETQKKVFFYSTNSEVFGFVKVVPTLGHTAGSLSFEINHGGREIVFVGDECYYLEECSKGIGTSSQALYDYKMNRIYIDYLTKKDKKTTRILTFHDPDALHFFQMNERGNIGKYLISTEQ